MELSRVGGRVLPKIVADVMNKPPLYYTHVRIRHDP
jgi:hypothetical protein